MSTPVDRSQTNSGPNDSSSAPASNNAQEEARYPDREFTLDNMTAKERNSGAISFKFTHEFRYSCFHFNFGLSQQRDKIIDPPRSQLVHHIKEYSPNYQFPKCLGQGDILTEIKSKKKIKGDNVMKIEWKRQTITADDDFEEDQQENGQLSDEEGEQNEDEHEEDLAGEYNPAQYEDNETGEDIGSDEGSDNDE